MVLYIIEYRVLIQNIVQYIALRQLLDKEASSSDKSHMLFVLMILKCFTSAASGRMKSSACCKDTCKLCFP